ncbi:hypothetical protein F1C15_15615 (plasmid) [Frigoribacterium sp. NBH87]|uniref:hypothetical protein n=1 Tax=Frigoribacterium sp. NBH87 TaxID=2596916 RepID=UPI001627CD9B|nr:hypothetical protein [Frigoribacterium sp. NBH87]QNE45400.1 hypothetical protein F1C15_15615 [Frigoribacterium sp. NBH87]
MTPTTTGIAIAATLVLTWIAFGFGFFVLVALAMVVGALIGRIIEGKLDPTSILDALRGKRSSS